MKITFTNTLEDFREAHGLHAPGSNRWLSILIRATLTGLTITSIAVWLERDQHAERCDLLIALIPPLIPTLLICTLMTVIWTNAEANVNPRAVRRRKAYATGMIIGLTTCIVALVSGGRRDVSITRSLQIATALMPSLLVLTTTAALMLSDQPDRFAIEWRMQKLSQLPQTLELTDQGLRTTTTLSESLYDWQCFSGGSETENLYVIRMIDRRFFMIPKRAFAGIAEETQFRLFIVKAVPRIVLLPREAAFEVVPVKPGPSL